jgi:hypothetical protein
MDKKEEFNSNCNEKNIYCCICRENKLLVETLMPSSCKIKHGNKCHRICQNCWWHPKTGFGRETSSHICPGCEKILPLTTSKPQKIFFIDLTLEN